MLADLLCSRNWAVHAVSQRHRGVSHPGREFGAGSRHNVYGAESETRSGSYVPVRVELECEAGVAQDAAEGEKGLVGPVGTSKLTPGVPGLHRSMQ